MTSLQKRLRRKVWNRRIRTFKYFLLVVGMVMIAMLGFRFDLSFGNDRITPVSITTDIWGNYKVNFTSKDPYNIRSEEGCYYIDRNQRWIAELVNSAINRNKDVVVYYNMYVGWKGFTSPATSPIVMAVPVSNIINSGNQNTYKRSHDDYEDYFNFWWQVCSYCWRWYQGIQQ